MSYRFEIICIYVMYFHITLNVDYLLQLLFSAHRFENISNVVSTTVSTPTLSNITLIGEIVYLLNFDITRTECNVR